MTRDATWFTFRWIAIACVALVFAALAFHRRWLSDDGLIVVRTVRQLLDGNGPVYNAFERAEPTTSTLWTYLLALIAGTTDIDVAIVAIYAGLVLAVAALAIAMTATSRFMPGAVPAGAFVVLGVYPFWDFATSGLETGLVLAWLACCWWLLVALEPRRLPLIAFVLGLGPLVRPELALVSIVFALAVWLLERPPWRRTLVLAALALALPLAYEVFRAGYYGTLVPLPALAKSAAQAAWGRGLAYTRDFAHPYALWIPALALIGFVATSDFAVPRRALIVIATPIVAGLVLALYVVRVGGDFMHARMLLAPVFLVLLPAFMLPLRRGTLPVAIVLAAWALAIGVARGDGKSHATIAPIEDERAGYVHWTGRNHPTDPARFAFADRPTSAYALTDILLGRRRLLTWGIDLAMNPERPGPLVYATGRLGTGGVVAPLDAIVADTLGLANPLGARITATLPGYPGHEKPLPLAWLLADYADPSAHLPGVPPVVVDAARRAMQCGELAELLASVRAPLTASRFWANLVGAPRRTGLAIPVDPAQAERRFCGEHAQSAIVTASTSWELDGWGRYEVIDGVRGSTPDSPGYTSTADAPQWIALDYAQPRAIAQVVLYPALAGNGFPVDVTIQTWDGAGWVDRATRTGMTAAVQTIAWSPAALTTRVRVVATKLPGAAKPELKLAEIEVGP